MGNAAQLSSSRGGRPAPARRRGSRTRRIGRRRRAVPSSPSVVGSCFERGASTRSRSPSAAQPTWSWSVFPGKTNLGRPAVAGWRRGRGRPGRCRCASRSHGEGGGSCCSLRPAGSLHGCDLTAIGSSRPGPMSCEVVCPEKTATVSGPNRAIRFARASRLNEL